MGLHGVSKWLREKYPHLMHKSHISLFAHERVFVDITSFIFKYVFIHGTDSSMWINQFLHLMLSFRKNRVYVVPVFDGQAPAAKADEQKARRDARAKMKERIAALDFALDCYTSNDHNEEIMLTLQKELEALNKRGAISVSLRHTNNSSSISPSDIKELTKTLQGWKKQNSFLTEDDHTYLRKLLSACGVSWIQAPGESEAYCCWLVRNGFGSAVVSIDTDCIAHRADIIINDIDKASGVIQYMNTSELLEAWQLEEEQLVDFGILVGCDYNPGSRVNKIGPVKAIKLLQQHGNIDDIPDLVIDVLKHHECRRLFNLQHDKSSIVIPSAHPDPELVKQLVTQRTGLNQTYINQLVQINSTKIPIQATTEEVKHIEMDETQEDEKQEEDLHVDYEDIMEED